MGLFEMMMGNLGLSILAWLRDHMQLSIGVMIAYFIIMYTASFQEKIIRARTLELVKNISREMKQNGMSISASSVYKKVLPLWMKQSKKWVLFLPGKYSLYPIPHIPSKNNLVYLNNDIVKDILIIMKKNQL